MTSLGEMIEDRQRKKGQQDSEIVIENLNAQKKEVENKLETLRKMIVNADVIDEAGNGISSLIEDIAKRHEAMCQDVGSTVNSLVEYKVSAENAIEGMKGQIETLNAEKDSAINAIQTSGQDTYSKIKKNADDAVASSINDISSKANKITEEKTAQAINQLNQKFAGLQSNMIELNDTMLKVLGVLQSPRRLEFDSEGMPTGVYIE